MIITNPFVSKSRNLLMAGAGTVVYTIAVSASVAMIALSKTTVSDCYGNYGCGTPCATSSMELVVAPVILILPFVKILTAPALQGIGLIARCAITSGIGVWGVAMALVFGKSWIW